MQCLQRLFGVTADQRRLRRQDFHIPSAEENARLQRSLVIEAIIAFPELDEGGDPSAVPEFFQHMAADDAGRLKCRLRLQATWTDDGTLDGAIEQSYRAVRTFGEFVEEDCIELKPNDRARIQMIYVPATRDGASQVTAFLRGRLWRAINWSQQVKDTLSTAGAAMNAAFDGEAAVSRITAAVRARWQQMHTAGTDTTPIFRPVDARWQELIRKVEVVFHPDEAGRERDLNDLSDGQRSLFHLAMTAATLDVETQLAEDPTTAGFQPNGVPLPALTLNLAEGRPLSMELPVRSIQGPASHVTGKDLQVSTQHKLEYFYSSEGKETLLQSKAFVGTNSLLIDLVAWVAYTQCLQIGSAVRCKKRTEIAIQNKKLIKYVVQPIQY